MQPLSQPRRRYIARGVGVAVVLATMASYLGGFPSRKQKVTHQLLRNLAYQFEMKDLSEEELKAQRDLWRNLVVFVQTTAGFRIGSRGEDGREGGTGQDQDLWHDEAIPREAYQSFHETGRWEMPFYTLLIGCLAYAMSKGLLCSERLGRKSMPVLACQLLAVGVATVVMGWLLAEMQMYPSGH